MEPPRDPEGNMTMHPDLVLTGERICDILDNALSMCLTWLKAQFGIYMVICHESATIGFWGTTPLKYQLQSCNDVVRMRMD